MPVTKIAIDGLWHCLCPSIEAAGALRSSFGRVPSRRALLRRSSSIPFPRNAPHTQRRLFSRTIRNPEQASASSTFNVSSYEQNSVDQSTVLSGESLASESTEHLYEVLRSAAAQGQYERVLELVNYLVKHRHEEPNLRLYSALLLANVDPNHGIATRITAILDEMSRERIGADSGFYHAALKVLSIHPDHLLRQRVLQEMRQRWFVITVDGRHDIAAGLFRERQIELALNYLDSMRQEGIKVHGWLYDLAMYILCDMQEFDQALKFIQARVAAKDIDISSHTWYYLLDTASSYYHYDATQYVWKWRVETLHINPPSGVCINALATAARHGDAELATDVFRVLGNRSTHFELHHYEALLEAYARSGDLETSFKILCIMKTAKAEPEEASTRPIFEYLCEHPPDELDHALNILTALHAERRIIPTPAYNVIIEAYIHHGDLAGAVERYKRLHTLCAAGPSTATFNILLRGCRDAGRKDVAMFLASEMLAMKIRPDALTYDRLILVCLMQMDFEDAFKYLQEMKIHGWKPRQGTLVAVVKKCVAVSDPRAWSLLEEMAATGFDTVSLEKWVTANWMDYSSPKKGAVSGK
ncbi:hypothetical protein L228DRAFT_282057 [Xylona heveae TC161]|uniref:Pentatricopeptide repeat-containing protein-mitochondrial domain-containing protein n=1 Tax=Xylona heveae (strain CBS 132557 / TC161) TaxID=1328760 RepID=A0A165HCZ4_XYLHT|nr:hypothetical protein L228DRAFT_282057 [Xylona heveae TC161]KZF23322.1 hypothetical protein L228DRAFT_282057 [Xylona heveae TC161]